MIRRRVLAVCVCAPLSCRTPAEHRLAPEPTTATGASTPATPDGTIEAVDSSSLSAEDRRALEGWIFAESSLLVLESMSATVDEETIVQLENHSSTSLVLHPTDRPYLLFAIQAMDGERWATRSVLRARKAFDSDRVGPGDFVNLRLRLGTLLDVEPGTNRLVLLVTKEDDPATSWIVPTGPISGYGKKSGRFLMNTTPEK